MRTLSPARTRAFSGGPLGTPGWPERNTHTDATFARALGYPAAVVSGQQAEGDLVRLLARIIGAHWETQGSLRVKFVGPVFTGESIRAKARLRSKQTDGTHTVLELEVWCEKEGGDTVIVGEARCRL